MRTVNHRIAVATVNRERDTHADIAGRLRDGLGFGRKIGQPCTRV
jgi:hypothetical protein